MLPFTIWHRILSCTGAVRAGITQLGHGHSQPRCANGISSFPPLFLQTHRGLAASFGWVPALAPDHTKPPFSEAGRALHSKFVLPALRPDTEPSEVAQGWEQGAEGLQNLSGSWGRHCLVLPSPSSQGQDPVGTTLTGLKATGNPASPCLNGNLTA